MFHFVKHPVAPMLVVLLFSFGVNMTNAQQNPPHTEVKPVVDTLHGVPITDPYRWLEDQESPETRAWIDVQNDYTESVMRQFSGMDRIKNRVAQLLKTDYAELPFERNGKYFISKRTAQQEQCIIYVREGRTGQDRVLIDPNELSEDHSIWAGIFDVSKDGSLMAYAIRRGGEDEVGVHFMHVENGQQMPDSLPRGTYFGLSINADNSGFYYTTADAEGWRVLFHEFGTDFAEDSVLFDQNGGPSELVSVELSEDRRFLSIVVYYAAVGSKSDVYFVDVANGGPVTPVVVGIDAEFWGQIVDSAIYIQTSLNAPNRCIWAANLSNPSIDNWTLVIPENDTAVLEWFNLIGGQIIATYVENVSYHVKSFAPDGRFINEIQLPSLGTVGFNMGSWSRSEFFFDFSSFHIPKTIYRCDLQSGQLDIWSQIAVLPNRDSVVVEQVWYSSVDGTRIPMFLVHRDDVKLDGDNPTLLTGYGGFGASKTPEFKPLEAIWVDAGGVLAVPSLRGGGEFGEKWHEAGKFDKKQNVFDDFISAAHWLINNRYTNPSKLAIRGGSNGGLLVGAAMTQSPDLFKAVVCTFPLLDMIRYHLFLKGPYWVGEYGSSDKQEEFEYIRKYSPYHNVKSGEKYPAVMFVTGDYDTRVAPLHARKMTALLQASTGSDNPVLLWYGLKAGHSIGGSASMEVDEVSAQVGFLCWQLGLDL